MNTLKLTALAILIPLGWVISADAYPQQLERLHPTLASTCHIGQRSAPASAPEGDDLAIIAEALRAIDAVRNTTEQPDILGSITDTCRLELGPIEVD
ncbi:hypothetical protein ACS3SW_10005 [Roseobacteraceae bacterium S113]